MSNVHGHLLACCLVTVLSVVSAAGCSDEGSGRKDASSDGSGTDGSGGSGDARQGGPNDGPDAGAADRWPGSCDPVLQNCSTATDECVLNCPSVKEFTCKATLAGTGVHGDPCGDTGSLCGKGLACGIFAADGGNVTRCAKYCDSNADCPAGKRCGGFGFVCATGDMMPIGRVCDL